MTADEIAALNSTEENAEEAPDAENAARVQELEKTVDTLKKEVAALKKAVKG